MRKQYKGVNQSTIVEIKERGLTKRLEKRKR